MEIGAAGTRLSMGNDVLGTWPHTAVRFSPAPELMVTIAGEPWLLDVDDGEAFLSVAQSHYMPIDAPPVTTQEPDPGPSDLEPDGSENGSSSEPGKTPSRDLPWHVFIPRQRISTLAIAAATSVVLLTMSITSGNALSAATGFLAGATGLTALLAWRCIASANRARVQSSIGPDIDAEARVARAVARAFSASTVTSRLEDQAVDDLTMVEGIGPKYAQLLIDVGVSSIEALADISSSQRAKLASALGLHSERVARERWVEQARRIIDDRDRPLPFG